MKSNSTYLFYPGGMLMPGRFSTGGDYRYGYNGMEMDNETSGNGNSYTTEFRQYDPRLMRWKSLDPLMAKFPWMSPYVAFNNNPIFYIDPFGLEGEPEKGFTCKDESGALRSYNGDGEWVDASQFVDSDINGVVILFKSVGFDDAQEQEDEMRTNVLKNDNSDPKNTNYKTIIVDDIRTGLVFANNFSKQRKDKKNVIVFRQHGNGGQWLFPFEDGTYVVISKSEYNANLDLPDLYSSAKNDFYNKLKRGDFGFHNYNTILIFTNCHSAYGEDGEYLGNLMSEFFSIGQLFMNIDSSPFQADTNFGIPLSIKDEGEVLQGWLMFQINKIGDFYYYEPIKTGLSLQLEKSGEQLFTQPKLKE